MSDTQAQLDDLPDEVRELIAATGQAPMTAARLVSIGQALAEKKREHVTARRESGIEEVWRYAEEAYVGIDDANRHEFANARWAKPNNLTGPVTTERTQMRETDVRSTVFVPLTRRYVDVGAAKVGEILLPIDGKAFSFEPTPNPDLLEAANDLTQVTSPTLGVPLERPARPDELHQPPGAAPSLGSQPAALPASAAPAAPGTPPMVPLTRKDLAEEKMQFALKAAKKAETRIYDWMVESQYPAQMRKVIFDASRIGVGVLHAPFPEPRISKRFANGALVIKQNVVPAYEWVDPWSIYPAPGCGEDIHAGDGIFRHKYLTAKQLRKLRGAPGYITAQINEVLKKGPAIDADVDQGPAGDAARSRHLFSSWVYHGTLTAAEFNDLADDKSKIQADDPLKVVHVIATLVNDLVIHCAQQPLDSGEFPYHAVPWCRRPGSWAGVGVAEQIAMPQRLINAATRAMANNAGKSAGSITVVDKDAIEPANGDWTLTLDKLFYKKDASSIDDVRKAFAFFQVPNVTGPLMSIIEYAFRLAEEATSIPLVSQGQSGTTSPETYGATQLQNNNANQLLRSIGYAFDDFITEPVVLQSYEWLLLDDTIPEEEKGDWKINAHGSTAFVERAIQDQTIQQMAVFVTNPAFGTDPKRWFAEFMRTKHLNPTTFQYTPEEQKAIEAKGTPPPPPVQVAQIKAADAEKQRAADLQEAQVNAQAVQAAAQIRGEATVQVAEQRAETDRLRVQKDTDRDTAYVRAEDQRTQHEFAARMREMELKRELAMLEYANKRELKLEDVKKQLADTSMRLQVQRELAGVSHAVDLEAQRRDHKVELHTAAAGGGEVIKPAAEPAGKAPAGESFAK